MAITRYELETRSSDETCAVGRRLGKRLVGGVAVGLVGHLGAGKTVLVKGMAEGNAGGAGVEVTSPTFTLVHEHPGRLVLYHLDAYRLTQTEELLALGFDELFSEEALVVVEWADRVRPALPEDTLWIELRATGDESRLLSFEAHGAGARRCLEAFRAAKTE